MEPRPKRWRRENDRYVLSHLGKALLLIHGPGLLSGSGDVGLDLAGYGLVWAKSTSAHGGVEA